jgi:2-C-methyl-D-erythritol 4-phosphate cytidylyltransferase/2-C-methyl-D-erythritol 2,4-cyclodiphosphate synthase
MLDGLRIGIGYDVHPFKEGRALFVGGVQIPHNKGLDGHSDADVLIHAVVDSILGALAAGDIGEHFPPSDPKWKGAASAEFLRYAAKLARDRGAQILSIDSTLIFELPKMKPHYEKMRARMAELLDISIDRIHVKATTTEKLGFTGREEGAAAQAVCLLVLKSAAGGAIGAGQP